MKSGVIVFPGSNCDVDCLRALNLAGANPEPIWHSETELPKVDLLVLPGGFSWGDYLRCGAIAAKSAAVRAALAAAKKGTPLVGICNGFQILLEAGCLPGALLQNRFLDFICEPANLRVNSTVSVFTDCYQAGEGLSLPVAHQEGQYFCSRDDLKRLRDRGQIAMTYRENPNGSLADIAALSHESLPVFGMMPHPERAVYGDENGKDGLRFWQNLCG